MAPVLTTQLLLQPSTSQLLIVDMQEEALARISGNGEIVERSVWLAKAAAALGIPKLLSEHCSSNYGPTHARLREAFDTADVFEKDFFSVWSQSAMRKSLERREASQMVLAGLESHGAILQSAIHMQQAGRQVFVVADAVGSRRALDHSLALQRLVEHGIQLVSSEMVLFEWTRRDGTPLFKQLQTLR